MVTLAHGGAPLEVGDRVDINGQRFLITAVVSSTNYEAQHA